MSDKKCLLVADKEVLIGKFETEKEALEYWRNRYTEKGYDWTWDYYCWEVVVPGKEIIFGIADVLVSEEEYREKQKNNKADIDYGESSNEDNWLEELGWFDE